MEENEIKIGTQIWTTKNLDVSTYRNGDAIPQVQDEEEWKNLSTGAWCNYENEAANGTKYGKLYNWHAVNDPRGLAPKGYHIPTDEEWSILTDYLGGEEEAGAKMKSNTWHETANDEGKGTNESGFAGLAGGYRSYDGDFSSIFEFGYSWSSSEDSSNIYSEGNDAWSRRLERSYRHVYKDCDNKLYGFSVRCIKD